MIKESIFRELALSFPEATEAPHFEKTSFRVKNKIFATLDLKNNLACIRLSPIDQDVFTTFDKQIIYPPANKWGKQGWTLVELNKVREDLFRDILSCGYCTVAPRKLAEQVGQRGND
ncbi:MmcQ/YjbR family DNA-binding protein [Daejeonella sp.]|uniref:MmcQ/YjbR family DNA-binding protein n=1 Tax=Daejeonella sp. TaxID=2805397 RepID=UPI00272761A2|nr:MmcQ/YjbR family DNA-binding protein [Daejeonella sp.]MDO8992203.1 MmcQ/YjbR family DNA-binding protein [Daejeonella sp.]MDP2415005.1 MmcQ/YjbR family DNA-binding protein [Daejeonella sp.]